MALTQISTAGVKDDAVTAGKIPANAVGSSELADNAVDTAAIADSAVTTAKIAGSAITSAKIADLTIGAGKLSSNAITTAKIADGNVTAAKLASGVQTTINNNADNRVITGSGTANTLEGESTLTYSDPQLKLLSSSAAPQIRINSDTGDGSSTRLTIGRATGNNQFVNGASSGDSAITFPSTLLFGVQTAEAMRIDSSGNLLLGTTTQNWKFQVFGGRSCFTDTSTYAIGVRKNSAQNSDKNFWIGATAANDNTNPDLVFSNNIGTEKFRFKESGGLTFNGDTAAANALNDYEEGSWTPTLTNTGTNASVNYTTQHGRYTKIGNVVYLFCFMDIPAGGITAAGTGDSTISGLPFATSNDPTSSDCHGSASDNIKSIPNTFSAQRNNAMLFFAHASSIIAIHQYNTTNPIYQTGWGSGQVANGDRFKWGWTARYRTDS
mgnify:CR=1 FL=1